MIDELPTVSVVVPARNAPGVLQGALDSVGSQDYPRLVDVVVAAADDASAAAARDATVVRNEVGSTPAGLNKAIAAAAGEVIVRCDAQSILPEGYITRAVATLIRTGAANVGGMQVPVGESAWEKAIAAAMRSPLGAGDARYRVGGDEGPAETVYLGVFRRDKLEAVGGFDETFERNQDYELNHRLIEVGELVWFDPKLKVEYRPRGSLGALARQYFEYGRAKRRFNRKHPGGLRWRQLAAPILVILLTASLAVSVVVPTTLLVILSYVLGLVAGGIGSSGNALRVAAALGTMHLSWGAGFLLDHQNGVGS